MIFITTGTTSAPFQRLIDTADLLAEKHEVTVQFGAARAPRRTRGFDFAAHEVILECMRQASLVVCHGGAGSIALALSVGRKPIVLPRDPHLGETVDDHQLAFCERLAHQGLITVCWDPEEIVRSIPFPSVAAFLSSPSPRLIAAITADVATQKPASTSSRSPSHSSRARETGRTALVALSFASSARRSAREAYQTEPL